MGWAPTPARGACCDRRRWWALGEPLSLRRHLVTAWTVAWLAWLGLHLLTLVGFRNRVSVFVNWAWSYLTWDRGPRLIFSPLPEERSPLPPDAEDDE